MERELEVETTSHTGTDSSTSPEEAVARLAELEAWLELNKLRGQGLGLGVVALQPLKEGQLLCVIPKEAVISDKTTAVADLIEGAGLYGSVGLAFALMHEMSLGTESKWYGYLQCLPAYEPLPMYWGDADRALLQGTELAYILDHDNERLQEDYDDYVAPLAEEYEERTGLKEVMTFDLFKRASSLVTSRAVWVDAYHGYAMVPVADIFNHTGNAYIHILIQSDGEVCTECGSPDPCPHTAYEDEDAADDDDDDDEEEDEEDEGEKGEVVEETKHAYEMERIEEESKESEEDPIWGVVPSGTWDGVGWWWNDRHGEHLQAHDDGDDGEREQCGEDGDEAHERSGGVESKHALNIAMIWEAAAGEEVYTNYGHMSNVVLLNKHGFVEIPNISDYVSVDEALVREVSAKCLGNAEAANKRLALCKRRKKIFGKNLCYNFHFNGTAEKQLLWVVFVLLAPPATCAKMAKPALLHKQLKSIDKRQLVADPSVRAMLVALVWARLALYPPTTLDEDRLTLAQAQNDGSKASLVWSLMLRVAEKELLWRVLKRYGMAHASAQPSSGSNKADGQETKYKRQPAIRHPRDRGRIHRMPENSGIGFFK